MSDLEEKLSLEEMTCDTGQRPVDGHDEFVRARIKNRLEKKKKGTAVYHDLDDVAAEFGFDAR